MDQIFSLLQILIIPIFAWVISIERRLSRVETMLKYLVNKGEDDKGKEGTNDNDACKLF